jgi:LPS export ABC transporter protein LptC
MILFFSCTKKKETNIRDNKPYTGPIMQATHVKMLMSDSAKLKIQMNAPIQNEFTNGDRFFPKSILVYFYDRNGVIESSLQANYGQYIKNTGIYTVRGDVIIKGLGNAKQMNTEELHWNPTTQRIYTEKFVRITTATEVLTGNGLDASQDFKQYRIRNPKGVFAVKH